MSSAIEVFPISAGFANVYLLKGPRCVLVDTGHPGNASLILAKLAERGISPEDLSLILLTHGHSDHFGSVQVLREATGAPVMVHQADAEAIRTGFNPELFPDNWWGRLASRLIPRRVKHFRPFEPDILINGEVSLAPYGIEGTVFPTPGHTPGSVSLWLENGDVFVGDLIAGGLLRHSRPGLRGFTSNRSSAIASLKRVLERNPQLVFCGHGGPFTPAQIRRSFSEL